MSNKLRFCEDESLKSISTASQKNSIAGSNPVIFSNSISLSKSLDEPVFSNSRRQRLFPFHVTLRQFFSIRSNRKKRHDNVSFPSSNKEVKTEKTSKHFMSQSVTMASSVTPDLLECPVCLMHKSSKVFPVLCTCEHRTCTSCFRTYLRTEIIENRVNISCPVCSERMYPDDVKEILNDIQMYDKYEEFLLRKFLLTEPDCRWCPAPDCYYAVIANSCASCPKLKCEREKCGTFFCYHCKQIWHPNKTCDAARQERNSLLGVSPLKLCNSEDTIKPCPRCGAYIGKMEDGSCNHMTCGLCGAEFCWLCMREVSDLHYLSPSGCTFWGKKPWSRKKKILWQVGTLIGAPVGIALLACLAFPALIIGIPIYVGRKIYHKYKTNRHTPAERNALVIAGVGASIIISPFLAAVTVGIGVPILLAYVYGVIPISLCRTGRCANNTEGLKVEFQDTHRTQDGENASLMKSENSSLIHNFAASGTHLDESVNTDCVSNTAIAGGSITGSGCDSLGCNLYTNKRKHSYSTDSVDISLGDNISTTTYPGSIGGTIIGPTACDTTVSIDIHVPKKRCFSQDDAIAVPVVVSSVKKKKTNFKLDADEDGSQSVARFNGDSQSLSSCKSSDSVFETKSKMIQASVKLEDEVNNQPSLSRIFEYNC